MSQPDGADRLPSEEETEQAAPGGEANPADIPYATLPDAELTPLMGSGGPAAERATAEFRRRHQGAVLAYARLCCRDQRAADRLADTVFSRAEQAIDTTARPREAWRHHLLLLVYLTAADWTDTDRYGDVALGLTASLGDSGEGISGDGTDALSFDRRSLLLSSFLTLPERTQALLWHSLVEEDAATRTARLLGLEPQSVLSLGQKALEDCREVYLRTHVANAHLARSGPDQAEGDECWRFSGLLEAEARRSGAHRSRDLENHLTGCSRCRLVLRELVGLDQHPAVVLVEGLLPWGGAMYLATHHTRRAMSDGSEDGRGARPVGSAAVSGGSAAQLLGTVVTTALTGRWPTGSVRRTSGTRGKATATLAVAIAVVAVTTVAVVSLTPGRHVAKSKEDATPRAAPSVDTSPPLAPASHSGTASPSPSTSSPAPSSPEHHRRKKAPKPSPSSTGGGKPSDPPKPRPAFANVVNGRNGLCLGVRDGRMVAGADVTVQTCSDAATQGWYMGSGNVIHSYADPSFCMDSRNDTDTGVGVWQCAEADAGRSDRLRFQTGGDGSIHPFIDLEDSAVTPLGDSSGEGVIFDWSRGYPNQHWCARGSVGLGNLPKC
ncbi:RICIN domain-containing protein [Streptomyces sp. NPDC048636]|uniref:RICIN domain-containing protein n=1 Tax=Streptomyces sp. NPDC048636 TaxID=3155762 RepID=UPI0034361E45